MKGDPQYYTERLKVLVQESGIVLAYNAEIAPAHVVSSGGRIQILPGLSAAEEFSVMVHEFAHERLHRGERRAQTSKIVLETEAEAVSFVVTTSISLDANTAAADYIQLYNGDKNMFS